MAKNDVRKPALRVGTVGIAAALAVALVCGFVVTGCATTPASWVDDFMISSYKGGVSIVAYRGNATELVIPSELSGKKVTAIEGRFNYGALTAKYGAYIGAFSNKSLTSVTIPDSVTLIGVGAFGDNRLTSVTIPNSVKDLSGFENNQLTSITIPNSVKKISGFANNRLTSVTIPNSVTEIGDNAFAGNQLTSVTIPDSVTAIGAKAFEGNQLTGITIPDRITGFGNDAFAGNQLTSVTIPGGITLISAGAFKNNQLTSVTIPGRVTAIGEQAFAGNQLTGITIPDRVTTIGPRAFEGNRLTSVTIPNRMTVIGEEAFANSGLTSVTIPDSVTEIRNKAFNENPLERVVVQRLQEGSPYWKALGTTLTQVFWANGGKPGIYERDGASGWTYDGKPMPKMAAVCTEGGFRLGAIDGESPGKSSGSYYFIPVGVHTLSLRYEALDVNTRIVTSSEGYVEMSHIFDEDYYVCTGEVKGGKIIFRIERE